METEKSVNRFIKPKLKTGIYNPNRNWEKCKPFYTTKIENGESENRYLKPKWKLDKM